LATPEVVWLGLMSGTSTDGVDAVAVRFSESHEVHVLCHEFMAFPEDLRQRLLGLQDLKFNGHAGDALLDSELLGNELSRLYAQCALQVLERLPEDAQRWVVAAGAHGQTIRHRPDLGATVQIFNPALFYELTKIAVVSDFRRADVAAGGQGAPLVPAFHHWWLQSELQSSCAVVGVLNIGGFANLSLCDAEGVSGMDTGPGNVLMDAWVFRHTGCTYDDQGAWAAQGTPDADLLARLLEHPYFSKPLPKSTGRDDFHLDGLLLVLRDFPFLSAVDVQATLLELTAVSIATHLPGHLAGLYICGGGAFNRRLVERLGLLMAQMGICIQPAGSQVRGLHPMQVEAVAFAWLARQRVLGRFANEPRVTGAHSRVLLGAITGAL
jgi:anhydro-N-acetylmuramic acid kinase